jgi:hypothetical protein
MFFDFEIYQKFKSGTTKKKEQRVPQPNFQYGKSIFGCIGSSKKAAQKTPIMNSEQLFRAFFSCFHGQKFNFLEFFLHFSVRTKKLLKIKYFFF